MSLTRARALRSLQTTLRPAVSRRTPRATLVARRFASDGGHGHGAPSSDLPWALGATAATIPAVWYLWPDTSHAAGHHGEHHEDGEHDEGGEHGAGGEQEEGHEGEVEEQKAEDEAPEKDETPADDSGKEEKSEDSSKDTSEDQEKSKESADTAKPSGTEGDSQPKTLDNTNPSSGTEDAEVKDDYKKEGKGNTSGVNFKGKMNADSEGHNDTRKSEPDSKGAFKKRIDSGLAKNLGEGSASGVDDGKQAGMSNTDTRHSVKIDESSEKSTKGEGAPETAKLKGPVDPSRPQK